MPRYTVRRGMRLIHKLHRHEVEVIRKDGDAWVIQDLVSRTTHVTQMGTFYSYYQPIGGGLEQRDSGQSAARERARLRRLEKQNRPKPVVAKPKDNPAVGVLDRVLSTL